VTDRDWHVFRGTGEPHDGWESVPAPMVARTFDGGPVLPGPRGEEPGWRRRLGTHAVGAHQLRPENLDVINAAILCRRPLLVTGAPGLGKSSLAALIARELKLGPVLEWPITSRETLQDGLYHYDALRRFEEASLPLAAAPAASRRSRLSVAGRVPRSNRGARDGAGSADVADYLTLGPLGTALLPYDRPRVLLIDEIDKADVDLPNDLLHVFEDGEFSIPELRRMRAHRPKVRVAVHGVGEEVEIAEGHVRCSAFPIIVLTSNGERDFPQAFLRRCLQLPLEDPDSEQLARIVAAHLGEDAVREYGDVIETFIDRRTRFGALPTDRLLIAIHILSEAGHGGGKLSDADREDLAERLMQPLDSTG
jgi:MoxR-like ATPase